MQYAGECWVGQSVGKYGKRPDKECNMPCKKDSSRTCGAGWRNSVFELKIITPVKTESQFHNVDGNVRQEVTQERHSDHRMGLNYLGCFVDQNNRDMTRIKNDASPKECFKMARDRGFEFAGIQNGAECFGSNKVGRYGSVDDK